MQVLSNFRLSPRSPRKLRGRNCHVGRSVKQASRLWQFSLDDKIHREDPRRKKKQKKKMKKKKRKRSRQDRVWVADNIFLSCFFFLFVFVGQLLRSIFCRSHKPLEFIFLFPFYSIISFILSFTHFFIDFINDHSCNHLLSRSILLIIHRFYIARYDIKIWKLICRVLLFLIITILIVTYSKINFLVSVSNYMDFNILLFFFRFFTFIHRTITFLRFNFSVIFHSINFMYCICQSNSLLITSCY